MIDIIITNDTMKINMKEVRHHVVVEVEWIDTVIKLEEVEAIVDEVEAPNHVNEIIGEEEGMTIQTVLAEEDLLVVLETTDVARVDLHRHR